MFSCGQGVVNFVASVVVLFVFDEILLDNDGALALVAILWPSVLPGASAVVGTVWLPTKHFKVIDD